MKLSQKISRCKSKQVRLGAKTTTKAKKIDDRLNKKIRDEIKENKIQVQNLRKMKKALKKSEKKPLFGKLVLLKI